MSEKDANGTHHWRIGGEGHPSDKPAERTGKRHSPTKGTDARPGWQPRGGTHNHTKRGK